MIYEFVKGLSKITTSSKKILPDVIMLDFIIVNAFIVGEPYNQVLVDTGLENSFDFILERLESSFKQYSRPNAIILTHGHFDHIGSIKQLLEYWDVDVYAHELEIPYLTGK